MTKARASKLGGDGGALAGVLQRPELTVEKSGARRHQLFVWVAFGFNLITGSTRSLQRLLSAKPPTEDLKTSVGITIGSLLELDLLGGSVLARLWAAS